MSKVGKGSLSGLRTAMMAGQSANGASATSSAKDKLSSAAKRPLIIVLSACLAIAVAPELKAQLVTPTSGLATTSYQELVDELLAYNLFKLSSDEQQIDINVTGVAALVGADKSREDAACSAVGNDAERRATAITQCTAALQALVNASFLKGDMADAASPVWRYDDNKLLAGMTPGARNLVVARVAGAGPTIRLRLAGEPNQFVVQGSANGQAFSLPLGTATIQSHPLSAVAARGGGRPYDATLPPAVLCLPFGENREGCQDELAIIRVGDNGLLLRVPKEERVAGSIAGSAKMIVSIDGQPVETDRDVPVVRQLRTDQVVDVELGGRLARFQIVERAVQLDDLPGMAGIAATVRASQPRSDIQTAILPEVHLEAQEALDRLAVLRANRAVSVRASATFMDGWTGEIVAMPTFPHREDQLGMGQDERRFRQEWLTSNMALVPLVVGSVAKVPFAAALLRTYPDLRDQIYIAPDSGPITTVQGERLYSNGEEVSIENLHGRQPFNFRQFIARSNNYYALAMMKRGSGAQNIDEWSDAFSAFNCSITKGIAENDILRRNYSDLYETEICSPTLWPNIKPSRQNALNSAEIYPANMNLDNAYLETNNYPDYYINVLGSGRSLWSGVALAQSFSRIITGRRISARFTSVDDGFEPLTLFEGGTDGQLRPLLDGMRDVVRRERTENGRLVEAGTAKELEPLIISSPGNPAPYANFTLFAKTGTFRIETSTAANKYPCIFRHLQSGGALTVRRLAQDRVALELAQSAGCNHDLNQLNRLNANANDLASFAALEDPRSRLVRTMPTFTSLTEGNGKALVLVFRCRTKPAHVRTIAINIQAVGTNDGSPAITYAGVILRQPAVKRWITRGC